MTGPLHTRMCDMFGLEFPIFAFTHCKDVAAAVTNAGGLGVLGMLMHTPDEMAADVKWLKERVGDRPFGVDLVFPASLPERTISREDLEAQIPDEHRAFTRDWLVKQGVDPDNMPVNPRTRDRDGFGGGLSSQADSRKQFEALLDLEVPLLVSGLGSPAFALEAAHSRGMKVGGLIGKVRQARREIEAGVDFIIAQGYDGGGHTGDVGTFSLVPQVLDIAGDTPVMAAGGVGTGRHLAAALAMGAEGTWSGTLWLASRESDADMVIKEKILASTEDDTVRSKSLSGKPQRGLRAAWNTAWEEPGAPKPLPAPLQDVLSSPSQFAAQALHENDPAYAYSPAGQVIGAIHEIKSCREIIFDMVEEAQVLLERFAAVPAE